MKIVLSAAEGRFAVKDAPDPAPSPGEVLVRVKASSVNPRDLRMARQKPGIRPGADFAGIVERTAGRSGPQPGDRVFGVMPTGAWSERIVVARNQLCEMPADLDFAEAASIAATGLTALYALDRGGSLIGKHVLVTAANGGVGGLACRIAVAAGALATGWIRSRKEAGTAAPAGLSLVAGDTLSQAVDGGPFDLAIDMVGGQSLCDVVRLLAPGGRCVVVGNASGADTSLNAADLYMSRIELLGFALFPELESKPASDGLRRLLSLWKSRAIEPPDFARLDFAELGRVGEIGRGKTVLLF